MFARRAALVPRKLAAPHLLSTPRSDRPTRRAHFRDGRRRDADLSRSGLSRRSSASLTEQGNAAFRMGDLAAALDHYERAIDEDSSDALSANNASACHLKLEQCVLPSVDRLTRPDGPRRDDSLALRSSGIRRTPRRS